MPSAEAFIELNKCSLFVQNSAFIGGEWVKATIPRDHVLGTRYRGHDAQGASRCVRDYNALEFSCDHDN
jgi:hypothetical protein